MSFSVANKKRTALYVSVAGLMVVVAAISAISAREPDGVTVRTGMILVTVGAAMWLPWQALIPTAIAVWLGPNFGRSAVDGYELFNVNMMLELPGLLALAAVSTIARQALRELELENVMLGTHSDTAGIDPGTGVFEESQLRSALDVELSRSRRFGRTFALVLVGIDEMRQRFDYRDEEVWQASFAATADLLRGTRANVDRVYRYGPAGFALVLPESGSKDVSGLVRRLRRVARKVKPQEGEPGGPLPAHYGATFFPTCATTVEDLIRRAEIALRISDNNANRVQLDGAEAPEMAPAETLRQQEPQDDAVEPVSQPAPTLAPALRILQPVAAEDGASEFVRTAVEPAEEAEPVATGPAPTALFAVETRPATPVDLPAEVTQPDASPAQVFAYRAPEPAVDVYNNSWQTEAPLSVIRRPQPKPQLVAIDGGAKPEPTVEDIFGDALKQLDGTLELIRSIKQRSA